LDAPFGETNNTIIGGADLATARAFVEQFGGAFYKTTGA
jgi:hypothetical protein